jgi:hypothetical protein
LSLGNQATVHQENKKTRKLELFSKKKTQRFPPFSFSAEALKENPIHIKIKYRKLFFSSNHKKFKLFQLAE